MKNPFSKGGKSEGEMSVAEALNVVRTGAKFWRAWAQLEEAAAAIEAQLSVQSERERAARELGEQLVTLKAAVEGAKGELADTQAAARAESDKAKGIASEILKKAEAAAAQREADARAVEAQAIARRDDAVRDQAAHETRLAELRDQVAAAEQVLARAEAVKAALG